MNSTELAWAAGFYDGEGCFMLVKQRRGQWMRLQMSVTQTELTTLERFRQAVGEGHIGGPYTNGKHKPRWMWTTYGPVRCSDVLDRLWPYLSEPKRKQVEDVVARYEAYRDGLTFKPLRRDQ